MLSVLLEATVQDKAGPVRRRHRRRRLHARKRTASPQTPDVVRPETLPATYTLLVDSSQSMARSVDFLRDAAGRLAASSAAGRPRDRRAVLRRLGAVTGPTADRATITDAIASIEPRGGTAILDSLADAARRGAGTEGRHVIVLVTDGYDEHSSRDVRGRPRRRAGQRADGLCHRRRRRRRHLVQRASSC